MFHRGFKHPNPDETLALVFEIIHQHLVQGDQKLPKITVEEPLEDLESENGATTECRATSDHLFYMCQNLFKNEA